MIVLRTLWIAIQIVILLVMALIAALPVFIIYLIVNQFNNESANNGEDILQRANQLN